MVIRLADPLLQSAGFRCQLEILDRAKTEESVDEIERAGRQRSGIHQQPLGEPALQLLTISHRASSF